MQVGLSGPQTRLASQAARRSGAAAMRPFAWHGERVGGLHGVKINTKGAIEAHAYMVAWARAAGNAHAGTSGLLGRRCLR